MTPAPNFHQFPDLGTRWIAFRESPFAAACVETIREDALRRAKLDDGFRLGMKVYATNRRAEYYRWIAAEALGLIDHLNGEPDMEHYVEQFEAALWPADDDDEPGDDMPYLPTERMVGAIR